MQELPKRETLEIEFKRDQDSQHKGKGYPDHELLDEVVGMTNAEGGMLYLGVENDGTITGLHHSHRDPIGLAAYIANQTRPSISVRTEILTIDGMDIMAITIPKSYSVIATASGKILKRRLKADGIPEVVPMYPYEIATRLSDLRKLDLSAQPIQDGSVEDFDENQIARLRSMIRNQNGDQQLLPLSDEELEKALQLICQVGDVYYPTLAGLLLLGKEESLRRLVPTATADFQVLQGAEVVVNVSFHKPILELVEIFSQYMHAWNPEQEFEYGLTRIPVPEFSWPAFREGIMNAFIHRDYSMLGNVHVQINDEGMTISNPGGFIEGIRIDNLLTVEPCGRNPVLSDALKRIGLAERTGRGVDRIYEGSITFGRPWPDYSESTSRSVVLFISRAKADTVFLQLIMDEQKKLGRPLSIHSLLVLSVLREMRKANINDLREQIHISAGRLIPVVEGLIENGLVEVLGQGKGRAFMLSSKVYHKMGKNKEYVRQKGIDTVRSPELILQLAAQQGGLISKEDVVELLHVSKWKAYQYIQNLCGQGQLVKVHGGRYSKYQLVNQESALDDKK